MMENQDPLKFDIIDLSELTKIEADTRRGGCGCFAGKCDPDKSGCGCGICLGYCS